MEHRLHRIGRTLASEGAVLEFYRDSMVLPDGKEELWDYVHHKKGGGACTVPVLPDGRILLIRQYRPAIDRETLELPAGARDASGEDPAKTAARELEEETGYRPGKMTKLAHILTAVAWCNESTDIYLAEDLVQVHAQHLDEAEEIELSPMRLEDLCAKIFAGEIQDAKTVAGIMCYRSRLAEEARKAADSGGEPASGAGNNEAADAGNNEAADAGEKQIAGTGKKQTSGEAEKNRKKHGKKPDTLLSRLQRVIRRARTG